MVKCKKCVFSIFFFFYTFDKVNSTRNGRKHTKENGINILPGNWFRRELFIIICFFLLPTNDRKRTVPAGTVGVAPMTSVDDRPLFCECLQWRPLNTRWTNISLWLTAYLRKLMVDHTFYFQESNILQNWFYGIHSKIVKFMIYILYECQCSLLLFKKKTIFSILLIVLANTESIIT